jgi:DNA-binding FadR family transcriptional regulator
LIETFGVSRTVVRDAVRTLAARGLVEVRHGSGTVVRGEAGEPYAEALFDLLVRSDVTLADLAKAREAVDLMLCERAAVERDEDDLARLRSAYAELCAAAQAADWASAERAHLRFHVVLVESVHLPGLEILLRPVQRIIVDTSLPPDFAAPESWEVESHLPILEAIADRDPVAAVDAMRRHYALFNGPNYREVLSRRVRDTGPRADPAIPHVSQRSSHRMNLRCCRVIRHGDKRLASGGEDGDTRPLRRDRRSRSDRAGRRR